MSAVLDLFAGTGVAVACRQLGVLEKGVEIMPEAIATRDHHGFSTPYNDVWEAHKAESIDFHTLWASPPCFGAGTPVLTQRGSISIEDVRVGDLVWTHKNRWRPVIDTMTRTAEAIRIGSIVTTDDHPFFSRKQWRKRRSESQGYEWGIDEESQWVPAGESRGMFWATPLAIADHHSDIADLPSPVLAGRYVADGWVGRDGLCIAVGDGRAEPEGDGWVISASGKNCRRFTKRTGIEDELVESFGSGAHGKTLPIWIFQTSVEYRKAFLQAYLEGDGTKTPGGHKAATVSANLASQLRLLAISLGYTSCVVFVKKPNTTVIEGRTVSQSDYYTVSFIENPSKYVRDAGGFHWTKQRRTPQPLGARQVYDITVEEDHSFTAWGYIVHNCQSFSIAGSGAGRKALDAVLELIEDKSYLDIDELRKRAEVFGDDRTGLVLTPLHYAARFLPTYIALEQVPPVLPVWEAMAVHLREMGYSVWTGYLTSEMYGVPQTRKRAFLMARRDGVEVSPPTPTHSRYYPRNPAKLDPGVQKWVSMAEALGFANFTAEKRMGAGMVERYGDRPGRDASEPAFTVRASAGGMEPGGFRLVGNQVPPGNERGDYHYRESSSPAQTLTSQSSGWHIVGREESLRSNYGTGGNAQDRGERAADEPSATITSKSKRNKWQPSQNNMSAEEAAILQTYPVDTSRGLTKRPSPTITGGGTETGGAEPIAKFDRYSKLPEREWVGGRERLTTEEAAILQSYPVTLRPELEQWKWIDSPATTVAGDPRITAREHHFHGQQSKTSLRLTEDEAASLQTCSKPFVFMGSKSKQFLQIGNAVPPLMAEAVLLALWQQS